MQLNNLKWIYDKKISLRELWHIIVSILNIILLLCPLTLKLVILAGPYFTHIEKVLTLRVLLQHRVSLFKQ